MQSCTTLDRVPARQLAAYVYVRNTDKQSEQTDHTPLGLIRDPVIHAK
jgi:hypothetical protein